MNATTRYRYEKDLEKLRRENAKLSDKLYNYRTSALEIYDGVAECAGNDTAVSKEWLLKKLKRCFQ